MISMEFCIQLCMFVGFIYSISINQSVRNNNPMRRSGDKQIKSKTYGAGVFWFLYHFEENISSGDPQKKLFTQPKKSAQGPQRAINAKVCRWMSFTLDLTFTLDFSELHNCRTAAPDKTWLTRWNVFFLPKLWLDFHVETLSLKFVFSQFCCASGLQGWDYTQLCNFFSRNFTPRGICGLVGSLCVSAKGAQWDRFRAAYSSTGLHIVSHGAILIRRRWSGALRAHG